jgi:hypothetical protein
MAVNFSPGVYQPRSIDFSELANLPDNFWKGQEQARQRGIQGARDSALAKFKQDGDYNTLAQELLQAGDIPGASAVAGIDYKFAKNNGAKAPKTVATPQGPKQWDGSKWVDIPGAGPKKASQEIKQENDNKLKQDSKGRLTRLLGGVTQNILSLRAKGGMVRQGAGAVDNTQAWLESSSPGQVLGKVIGSPNQTSRDNLKAMRSTIANQVRAASGMSAKAFDSNFELQTYLNSISDPGASDISNLVAVDVLDQTFGLGGMLDKMLPPDLLQRVRAGSAQAIQENPITIVDEGAGGGGTAKASPTPDQQKLYEQHKSEPGFLEEWNKRFGR